MANLWQPSINRVTDDTGSPMSGARMYLYRTGTLVPALYYLDAEGTVPGTNPQRADADGIFSPIFLDPDAIYRIRCTSASGAVPVFDVDPVRGFDESQFYTISQQVAADAEQVAADRVATEAARDEALDAAGIAQGAALTKQFYPGARSFVPQGLKSVAITAAGTGGTNGSYVVPLSGDNLTTDAFVNVTVSGGAVTAVSVNAPGLYIGNALNIGTVNLSSITGLTGATVTPTGGYLVNSGEFYYTNHATDPEQVSRFQNQSNAAVEVDASVDYLNIALARGYAEQAEAAVAQIADAYLTLGDYVDTATYELIPVGSGVARPPRGMTYPAGGSGTSSSVRATINKLDSMQAGEIYTFRFGADRSSTFDRLLNGGIIVNGVSRPVSGTPVFTLETGRLFVELDYEMQGDEVTLTPFITTEFFPSSGVEQWYEITNLVIQLKTPAGDTETANKVMLDAILGETLQGYAPVTGLGDILEQITVIRDVQNSATTDGRFGMVFPAGTNGDNSTYLVSYTIDGDAQEGRDFKLVVIFEKSATFTRTLAPIFLVATQANPGGIGRTAKIVTSETTDYVTYTYEYTTQGDELKLLPAVQQTSLSNTVVEEQMTLAAFVPDYLNAVRLGTTSTDEAVGDFVGQKVLGLPVLRASRIREADDYGGPVAAMDAITRAAPGYWYRIELGRGTYSLPSEIFYKDYVELIGKGRSTTLRFFQPNNTPAPDIQAFSAVNFDHTGIIKGLDIEVKNCRYGIHWDTAAVIPKRHTVIENMRVRHFGNDEADFPNAWPGQNAVGAGVTDGQFLAVRDSYLWSKNAVAFSCHNTVNATYPCRVEITRSILATNANNNVCMVINAIGSGQADEWVVKDTVLGGKIVFDPAGWIPNDLANQPSNRFEFHVTGSGNSPAVFLNNDPSLALTITSATTAANSSVGISGDAVPLIFGDGTNALYTTRPGSVVLVAGDPAVSTGFPAAVWGWGDVSGMLGKTFTTLGQRLGNRTGSSRTLTVTVDGGAPINIVFNADYTSMTNADILIMLNTALGSAATADLFAAGARMRPEFTDEERQIKNTSSVGIPFGSACAYNGNKRSIRLMTNADPANLFAGIAWEDIPIQQEGRVKHSGYLPLSDVRNTVVGPLIFNATMSVGAIPGVLQVGGTQGLLPAISDDAVQLNAA